MASDNIRVLGGLDLASTLSFEQNYSGFPADPKPRTLVVKEGMAYLYTELVVDSGYFTWTPIGLKQTAYLHTQGVASTTWTVTHDFGTTDFGYFVYDNNHHLVVASVTVIDENSVLINLAEAITGTAVFFSIQHVSAPNVTAVDSITINTMTLRDAIGVLTVNNNAVAMEESVANRLAQKYSTTQADAAIAAAVSAEAVLRTAADGTLSARIDSVLSNIDGTALNSLSEIVAAFQAADGTLNGAISSLGTNASSALGTEASTARAAEATLTANLASEVTNRGTAVSGAITTASGDATSKVYTETTRAIAAEATLTTNLGSEVSAARAAEATLTADLASEVTTRGTAVSGAITTAASDATAKVLTETNRATAAEGTLQGNITSEAATARAAESTLTTNLASEAATARAAEATLRADLGTEASTRTTNDATTLASAKSYTDAQIVPVAKTYLGAVTGDILPAANVTYNLGSPTKAFHSVYVGPGTLYVNGKAVIEDVSDTMTFATDLDQNLRIQSSGSGHLELQSDLGTIDIKGTLAITSGKRITSSDGVEVNFGDDIRMNSNKITLLGVPTANADAATKAYVDSMTIYDTTIIRTGGTQTIAGVTTFTDGIIAGNLTVNGTTTTVNSETIKLADNIIDLNSNMTTGAPTENSGLRIMRGDEAATQLRWNEANDKWELTNDGSTYSNVTTAADLAAEATTARAAESTLTTNLASEVTNRGTAVSSAISTAAADATAKVAAEASARNTAISTGTVANALVAGTVYTAAQPNITSVGTLTSLNVTGNTSVGNLVSGGSITGANLVSANYFTGTLTTAAQPNVTSVGTLTSLTVSGTVAGVTKTMVGLGNVDNTADSAKPVSTAQATADTAIGTAAASDATAKVLTETNARTAADATLTSSVVAEAATARAAEATLRADLASEVTNRGTAVSGAITTASGDATSKVAAEAIIARAAEAALGVRVDNILTNTDGTALNSLSELVTAFQAADGTLNGAISALGTSASSALGTEASTARAAEATLRADLASEVTNRGTAVSGAITTASGDATAKVLTETNARTAADATLTANLASEAAAARAAEATLTANLASEVTNRGTAVSGAITTASGDATTKANAAQAAAASDATAKVLTETNARTAADATLTANLASEAVTARAAESTLRADLASEVTNRGTAVSGAITTASGDATTKANAAQAAAIAASAPVAHVGAGGAAHSNAVAAGAAGFMTGADKTKLDGIAAGATTNLGTVTAVTATGPVASSGGTTPVISMAQSTTSANGWLSSTDWNTFNGKQAAGSYQAAGTYVNTVNGNSGTVTAAHISAAATTGYGYTPYNAASISSAAVASATVAASANSVAGANVTGTVSSATTAGTVTTAAQGNITSVGTLTSLSTTGDVTVGGNLTVSGTTTTINATTLDVADLNITVAKNAASAAAANGAGITVNGAAATLTYTSGDDRWNMNKNLNVTTVYGNVSGTAATITGVYGGSLTSAQVTTALTYTPYNSTNPSGYTTNVGTVTGVTATGPVVSSGGTAPVISMAAATTSVAGYLTAADWNTFNGKQAAGSYQAAGTYVNTVNGNSGTVTAAHISAAATAGYGYTPYNAASIGSASVNYAASAGSAPASDVYAWAKAATKPAYNSTEVGLGNVNNTADSAKSVSYAATAGSAGSASTAGSTATVTAGGSVTTTTLTTGATATAGTITGNWSLAAGSKLNATYADLAEKYEADAQYEAGTVLSFGGDKEVTAATESNSTRVAGVVSTDPAYVMNNECAGEFVAVLALQGRVPCKVTGSVRKGDLMVAAGYGFARANNEARSGTIIGKALANFDGESGVIEVVVGRF